MTLPTRVLDAIREDVDNVVHHTQKAVAAALADAVAEKAKLAADVKASVAKAITDGEAAVAQAAPEIQAAVKVAVEAAEAAVKAALAAHGVLVTPEPTEGDPGAAEAVLGPSEANPAEPAEELFYSELLCRWVLYNPKPVPPYKFEYDFTPELDSFGRRLMNDMLWAMRICPPPFRVPVSGV